MQQRGSRLTELHCSLPACLFSFVLLRSSPQMGHDCVPFCRANPRRLVGWWFEPSSSGEPGPGALGHRPGPRAPARGLIRCLGSLLRTVLGFSRILGPAPVIVPWPPWALTPGRMCRPPTHTSFSGTPLLGGGRRPGRAGRGFDAHHPDAIGRRWRGQRGQPCGRRFGRKRDRYDGLRDEGRGRRSRGQGRRSRGRGRRSRPRPPALEACP